MKQLICFAKLILLLGTWENTIYQSNRQRFKNGNIFPIYKPNSENDGANISTFEGILEICSLQVSPESGQCWHTEDTQELLGEGVSRISITKISLFLRFSCCLHKVIYKQVQVCNLFCHSVECFMYFLLLTIKKAQVYLFLRSQDAQTPLTSFFLPVTKCPPRMKTQDISSIGSKVAFSKEMGWSRRI